MEVLLQWLDELDDLAAAALFIWHRIRAVWLAAGLAAALLVPAGTAGLFASFSPFALTRFALGCVLIWGLGGLLAERFERRLSNDA